MTDLTTDPTLLWRSLLTTATVGLARQPVQPPPPGTPLTDLLLALDPAAGERWLLGAAATLTLYRRAGQLPAPAPRSTVAPCPDDARPVCSARAAQHLHQMLNNSHAELLAEWLAAAAAAGQRVREEQLVALLSAGQRQSDLRAAIVPVLGERGRWLAAQNPAWEYARVALPGEQPQAHQDEIRLAWETGSSASRRVLFAHLRRNDPTFARALLASTWKTEKADDRAEFVASLAQNLSMEDEPFLEAALDDRSREVRRAAASLLTTLPDSRLVQRMIARLIPLFHWTPAQRGGLLRREQPARLSVTPPEACDAALQRDGVEPKPGSGFGEKAWWLLQMLGSVPPDFWCTHWATTPAALLDAIATSEWEGALLAGWQQAAQRNHTANWAVALLSTRPDAPGVTALVSILTDDQREALTLQVLHSESQVREYLRLCQHPWSEPFTRAVFAWLRKHIADQRRAPSWMWLDLLRETARYVPTSMTHALTSGWPEDAPTWSNWQGAVDAFQITLAFRHAMLKEFNQ